MLMWSFHRADSQAAIGIAFSLVFSVIAGPGPATAQQPGTPAQAEQEEAADHRGIIGIFPTISAETVGSPAQLIVGEVAPNSPAHFAGIEPGDQIVAVDGKPVSGQKLHDVAAAIRGEVGTSVKLTLNRRGQSREISLTRVAPDSEHHEHHMGGPSDFGDHGMMRGHHPSKE